jgi:hypothetical protein
MKGGRRKTRKNRQWINSTQPSQHLSVDDADNYEVQNLQVDNHYTDRKEKWDKTQLWLIYFITMFQVIY